jgi:hypothetical protein
VPFTSVSSGRTLSDAIRSASQDSGGWPIDPVNGATTRHQLLVHPGSPVGRYGSVVVMPLGVDPEAVIGYPVLHPLYGQVRRRRAAHSRLRRLRGLIASELAASSDRDDIRVVVRRATLSLDSDLTQISACFPNVD